MNKSNKSASQDRRRFFRIEDKVNLFYKIIDEKQLISVGQMTDSVLSNCSLVTALDVLDQESRIIMFRIEKNDPEMAEYLKVLDSKINLLAEALMRQENDFSEGDMRNANISASGLAFEAENPIEEGEFLEIKLLLTSCFAVIVIYGKVIYCRENTLEDTVNHYQIGIDYINMKEQDREVLIKHVVKRQMQQIRENKEN